MISFDRFRKLRGLTFYKKASLLISQHMQQTVCLEEKYINEIFERLLGDFTYEQDMQKTIRDRVRTEGLLVLKDYLDTKCGRINPDLDFIKDGVELDVGRRKVKERYLVLDNIRSPYNLGSIIRSSESFMIKQVILLSDTLSSDHPNVKRAACRADLIVPCRIFKNRAEGIDYIKSLKLPIFSLECGGMNIDEYDFQQSAIAIVGNEEFGVSQELLDICESVVSIPTYGCKGSISVSCATAIMLYKWSSANS